MAEFQVLRWVPHVEPTSLSRRDRQVCDYRAYLPDLLADRSIELEGSVAADVSDAELALAHFDARARALIDTEALARLLLRAESVASSRIEGLEVGPRRLLRADAEQQLGEPPRDVTAAEVLSNVEALRYGTEMVDEGTPIGIELLLEIHRRLLGATRLAEHAGRLRTAQNWIGGSGYNPCSATFVPPPPDALQYLMDDLMAFCNADGLPAVAQAAIAHAQFETIHPFVDGNGRVGRALIHLIVRRRGLAQRTLPPISLILATSASDYIAGLTATRYEGAWNSPAAKTGMNLWIGRFAAAAKRAVADADTFERRIEELERRWRESLGRVRANSALDLLLKRLPGMPVLTVQTAATIVARSFEATNNAVAELVRAGIVRPIKDSRRNRAFEAPEIVAAFIDLERSLASPAGDTRVAPPMRPVPRRKA